jgi:hypothetical protein
MNATLSLVCKVCADKGLDYLLVYDQGKRSLLYEAEGVDGVADALEQLPDLLTGTVRVVAGRSADRDKGKDPRAFEWHVNLGSAHTERVSGVGDVPTWREMLDLRLELQEMKLRGELQQAEPGYMGQLVEMLNGLIRPGGVMPAKVPDAAAKVAGAAQPDVMEDLPPEVLEAARNVALLYRKDPATFAAYAPALASLVKDGNA